MIRQSRGRHTSSAGHEGDGVGAGNREVTFTDLVARRYATKSPLVSWVVFERIGGAIAWLCSRIGTTPSTVTLVGCVIGIAGAACLGRADTAGHAGLAALLLLLAYCLDCTDGQLARATGRTSARGAWLDVVVDGIVLAFTASAVAYALLVDGDPSVWDLLLVGGFAASRMASLFTATLVRSSEDGGLQLTGLSGLLRTVYTAVMDTPVVYLLLCLTRLHLPLFASVVLVITLMTLVQTAVSARNHFSGAAPA